MSSKNKLLAFLLALLVVANIATIGMYWLGRQKKGMPPARELLPAGRPSDYLIKALGFDSGQQAKYMALVKTHQQQTSDLRSKTAEAKDRFFELVKQPVLADSTAQRVVRQISELTAQQDMATLKHFRQVRAICNAVQLQKFDSLVLHQVLGMMARQGQSMPPPPQRAQNPPRGGRRPPPNGERPPPPDGNRPPPPGGYPPPPKDGNGQPPPPPPQ